MPLLKTWTPAQDAEILRLRAAGTSWTKIGEALGLPRNRVIARGRRLKATAPPPMPKVAPDQARTTEPLPAGHPATWGLICSDPYPAYDS